jgi:hypothetical protein
LRLSTILLVLSWAMILHVLPSCRCVETVTSDTHHSSLIAHSSHHDTVVLRDSVYIYERMKGDTVYLTRTEWRERWCSQIIHDTIRDTEYVTQVIEKPPVRYVPKFYKWCTVALWAVLGVLVVVVVLKVRLRGWR